jgi:Ras-related GTP-binding protein A/B
VRFLGNLALNLWDCGGQEAFMENYFSNQRDHIFRNVEVLIYVFDVESSCAEVLPDGSSVNVAVNCSSHISTLLLLMSRRT